MQGVFAFNQRQKANYSRATEYLDEIFSPDLNSMDKPDYKLLHKHKTRAQKLFSDAYLTKNIPAESDESIKDGIRKAINYFQKECDKDIDEIKQLLLADIDQVIRWVFSTFQFTLEIKELLDDKRLKTEIKSAGEYNLCDNKVLNKIKDSEDYQAALVKYDISWDREDSLPWKLLRDKISKDISYIAYTNKAETTFEEDLEIVSYLIKKVLFKDDMYMSHFEDIDLYAVENQDIVKSILVKNLKTITEDSPIEFITVPENWEDDKSFYEILFKESVKRNEDIDAIIDKNLKNWESDRLAGTDIVIIKMAITEMLNFPSIPVKVTINEFIELAKKYSTPKSKIFINGVLDTVSKELKENGVLKKSGRGLIDNK